MKAKIDGMGRQRMNFAGKALGIMLAAILVMASANAQTPPPPMQGTEVQTFYLTNLTQANDANEVANALRNLLDPAVKSYLVPSENAIVMRGTPDQLKLAQKLLIDLDRIKKIYRLTYTMTEMDGGKRIGVQHFAMIVVSGGRTVIKQASKVPYDANPKITPGMVGMPSSYHDVGLNIDASLDGYADGVRLRTKVEQSSLAEGAGETATGSPVIRQTSLEGTSILSPGKPLVLGSLDVPGSTRHLDVEVLLEILR